MAEAAKEIGVSASKISRIAAKGKFKIRKDRRDERVRLVDVDEIRKFLETEPDEDEE